MFMFVFKFGGCIFLHVDTKGGRGALALVLVDRTNPKRDTHKRALEREDLPRDRRVLI